MTPYNVHLLFSKVVQKFIPFPKPISSHWHSNNIVNCLHEIAAVCLQYSYSLLVHNESSLRRTEFSCELILIPRDDYHTLA